PACCTDSHIKRPLNAFMLWSRLQRRKFVHANPGMHHPEVSKLLGVVWRQLPMTAKRPYIVEAGRLSSHHAEQHPTYRYKNRRRSGCPLRHEGVHSPCTTVSTTCHEIFH
ncbi:unnamed protein product, partial [Ixodes persulcatus]